jgi:ABC-2 type transport system permease protein
MNIVLGILLVVLIMAGIVALLVLNPVIMAVSKRNATAYFSGVLGYLFIVTFVVLAALLTFNKQFFANNLVNLDQLNQTFPMLLMFIVPAITMSAWADERKLGPSQQGALIRRPGVTLSLLL